MQEKMPMRLNKYLSAMGVCSRREADRWIEEGRVKLNGETARKGMLCAEGDCIEIDGKRLGRGLSERKPVLLAYYKPRGVVCTTSGKDRAKTIVEAVDYPERVYPIGRLDKDSEGLILLTNQGEFVNRINRARNMHEKEYVVTVDKEITGAFLAAMAEGVFLQELGQYTRPCKIWQDESLPIDIRCKQFHIVLTQGLNRQIRRMCAAFSYEVVRLVRVRILSLGLEGLRPGEYREIAPSALRPDWEW